MANVIKHKRGSGSDPGASDLVVGEVAIRTDVGKLFTKMDNGSVAEIAGGGSDIAINTLSSSSGTGGNASGVFDNSAYRFTLSAPPSVSAQQLLVSINGVIQKPVAGTGQPSEGFSVDGTDIILGDAPATGADFFILTFKSLGVSEPADNSVTSAKIADGAIVNADVNASAAIAGTKISPDFGSQAITTTGNLGGKNLNLIHINPTISLTDSNADDDFEIKVDGGNFKIRDATNSADRLTINSSGTVNVTGNLDVGAGIDVTGDISSTGDYTITNISPTITFLDSNANSDFKINVDSGVFSIKDQTNVDASRFVIDSSGKIGIGTTSPSNNLEVASAAHTGISIQSNRTTSTDNIGALDFISSSTNVARIQTLVDGTIKFRNTSALHERMRIDSSGRLLVGGTDASVVHTNADDVVIGNTSASVAGLSIATSTSGYATLQFSDGAGSKNQGQIAYNHADNSLALTTDSSVAMSIDSSGLVGIGTTNPTSLLTLNHATSPFIRLNDSDTTKAGIGADGGLSYVFSQDGNPLVFTTSTVTAFTERMRIDSSGNVGIGTTSPARKFEVHDTAATVIALNSTSSSGTTLRIQSSGTDKMFLGLAGDFVTGQGSNVTDSAIRASGALLFAVGGSTERMRIDSSGNMLLGRTSISFGKRLNIQGSSGTQMSISSADTTSGSSGTGAGIEFRYHTGSDETACDALNVIKENGTSGNTACALTFKTKANGGSPTERMRIKSDGDIVKTVVNNMTFRFDQTSSNNNKFHNFMYSRSGSGRGDCSVIAIGEGSSSQGNIKIRTSAGNAGISGGVELINGNTAFNGISDIRLKNKISDITDALTNIDKIEPIKYSWKYDTQNTPHIGISAQSVNEVYPELIELTKSSTDESDETDYLSVLHTELIPVCIAAIKELKAKVEALEAG